MSHSGCSALHGVNPNFFKKSHAKYFRNILSMFMLVGQVSFSKIHPSKDTLSTSYANTSHDVRIFTFDGMVQNVKN